MRGRILSILAILVLNFTFSAKAEYSINENCVEAWQALLDLKINTAKAMLADEIRSNPKNYYAYYLAQTCDLYALVINGSEDNYERFTDQFERRRRIMDDKDTDSPYYLYCESEMYLQICIMNVFYGDKLTGIRKGYKAYKKLHDNMKLYPDFIMNNKLDGFFNITITNMPSFAKWAASVFGVSGDAENGFRLLHAYFDGVKENKGLKVEAALFLMFTYKLNNEPLKAYQFIRTQDSTVVDYRLIYYLYANTAYRSGFNEEAYNIFTKFDPSQCEIPFTWYDFMMGKILLRRLDQNAGEHLERFLQQTRERSYIKEINYKLAIFHLINDNKLKFETYKVASCEEGDDVTERDREAVYDCDLDYIPDIGLTKTRLLIEGDYLDQGLDYLDNFEMDDDTFQPYKLQYLFLKGRYDERTENFRKAIRSYKEVIELGKDEYYHFASEAALRIGLINMNTDQQKAEEYLELARELYDSDYYQYIDDMAKRELKKLNRNK